MFWESGPGGEGRGYFSTASGSFGVPFDLLLLVLLLG